MLFRTTRDMFTEKPFESHETRLGLHTIKPTTPCVALSSFSHPRLMHCRYTAGPHNPTGYVLNAEKYDPSPVPDKGRFLSTHAERCVP